MSSSRVLSLIPAYGNGRVGNLRRAATGKSYSSAPSSTPFSSSSSLLSHHHRHRHYQRRKQSHQELEGNNLRPFARFAIIPSFPSTLVRISRQHALFSAIPSAAIVANHDFTSSQIAVAITRSNNTTNNIKHNLKKKKQPRLEALRSRLRSEGESGDATKSLLAKQQQQPSGGGKGCSSSATQTSQSSDNALAQVNIEKLIHEILPQLRAERAAALQHPLQDKYQRHHNYLRLSLVERCNLRCQYCMPPEGVPLSPKSSLLTTEELLRISKLFIKNGVNKVRLTGGEPTLRKDLADIIRGITVAGHEDAISGGNGVKSIGITTNGLTLERKLPALIDAGLTHVNLSLDTLQDDKFTDITRRKGLKRVLSSIESCVSYLSPPTAPEKVGRVKVNCVVMQHFNTNELRDFVELTKDMNLDVRFIEWMPFSDNGWNDGKFMSYQDMLRAITSDNTPLLSANADLASTLEAAPSLPMVASLQNVPPLPLERISDGPNDTTKWYRVPGYQGRVGFITSMSEHFCGTCNRLRITADGGLKVCLFGGDELSLRDVLRYTDTDDNYSVTDDDLELLIGMAVRKKKAALGGHGDMYGIAKANDNRPMTLIGG